MSGTINGTFDPATGAGNIQLNGLSVASNTSPTASSSMRQFDVRQFGAKGDGITDDTAAIQAADTAARASSNAQVYLPAATYVITQLVIYSGSNWIGDGRDATILRQKTGTNTDALYGNNSNANWGSTSPKTMVHGYTLQGLTIDGQWNGGTGNTTGNGIAVFGSRPILRDIFIRNVAGNALRTDYYDNSIDLSPLSFRMEGSFINIRVDTCGQHGWWNNGPHDSFVANFIVADAGQSANGKYCGFYFDKHSGTVCFNIHAWTQSNIRMKHALHCDGFGHQFKGSVFEGIPTGANVNLVTNGCDFDSGCQYYASGAGAVCIYMGGPDCTGNNIKGTCGPPGAGAPPALAVKVSKAAGDWVANNKLDLLCNVMDAGNIDFGNSNGTNVWYLHCYNSVNTSAFIGTPNPNDSVHIRCQMPKGFYVYDSEHQNTYLNVGSKSSVTWNYLFPFGQNPMVVSQSVGGGDVTVNAPSITNYSTHSVTFYNPNTFGITIFATANRIMSNVSSP